jgi:hypothetical protein
MKDNNGHLGLATWIMARMQSTKKIEKTILVNE